jgi:hypothetical protein
VDFESLMYYLKVLMTEVIIMPTIEDNKHSRAMYGGIKVGTFYTADRAVTSTTANFLAVAMTVGFLKQIILFRRRPFDALCLPKRCTYTEY